MKKRKSNIAKFLVKATAGAAIGIAAFMLFKSERTNIQKEKIVKKTPATEELFI